MVERVVTSPKHDQRDVENRRLPMICDDCHAENPEIANYCLICGVRMRPVPSRPSAERRPMHVIFCDVVGSTPLSQELDPEDLRDLLQDFQRLCAVAVDRLEGHVAQLLGDGVLVYFGYPHAHEDDAERAVRAGLAIVRAVARGTVGGRRLKVRVGIHSGLVVIGEMGIRGYGADLAVGETPNIAARVQAEALPNTVAISQATERLVRGFFATEDLGLRSLKGVTQPLRLFHVLAESGARNRLEAATASGLTPFVGRADEMAFLLQNWAEVRAGRGRVVSIRGEAGVGKSRLVDAFKARIAGDAFEAIHCPCSEYLRNSAFHPFAAALAYETDFSEGVAPERRLAQRDHFARRFSLPPAQAAFVLGDLLAIQVETGESLSELAPTRRRQLTMDALSSWLLQPAADLPRLVVLEDAQWADASTIEVIESIAKSLASCNVLILVTFRPDFPAAWTLGNPLAVLQLRPLTPGEASAMASCVAHGKTLPGELTNRLADWTKGVPLYIEEFTKGLLESGALVEHGDRFELSAPLPKNLIPETLAGPLAARIDRLALAKTVLQLASVVGMDARYDMLAAVSDLNERELREAIARLVASELVIEHPNAPVAMFQFKHALIRDAAYNSLLLSDRRETHRRIFQALRGRFPDVAENRPEIVANHAAEAGLAREAIAEWYRATEKALSRAANVEALAHLDAGLKQIEKLEEGTARYEQQLKFELARGPALMAVEGYAAPEVKETYRRAHDLCQKLDDLSRLHPILWGLWAHHFVAGELVPARDFGEQVLRLAEATGDPALLVPAYHAFGYTLCYAGEFAEALEVARAGIALFDLELERRNVRQFQFSSAVALHHFAANSLWMLGFADQARAQAERAIELGRELAHPPSMAYAHSALTWGASFLLGEFEALDAAGLEAIELSRTEEYSLWPPLVQTFRGWAMVASGRVIDGLSHMHESFSKYRRTGGGVLRPTVRALLAEATWRAGDSASALAIIEEALSDILATHEHNYEPELHRIRGEIFAREANDRAMAKQQAEASFRVAMTLAGQQRAQALELRAATSLAAFLREQGRRDEGRSVLSDVYGRFKEGFETRDLIAARAELAL
jgi:predicted ATPase/class 3 adenylate cyclase